MTPCPFCGLSDPLRLCLRSYTRSWTWEMAMVAAVALAACGAVVWGIEVWG